MLTDDGLGTNQAQCVAPGGPTMGEPDPESAVGWREPRTLAALVQQSQLLAEGYVLEYQMATRPQGGNERAQQDEDQGTHERGSANLRQVPVK